MNDKRKTIMRVLFFVLAMFAIQLPAMAATKVAVVDMERALFLSDAAKKSIKKFESDNKADVDKLKGLEKELLKIREKLEKDADVMSDSEASKLKNQFEEKGTEFQFYARKLQKLEQEWKQGFFKSQLPAIQKLLKEIIDEGKYDVVLQAGAVVYTSPKADITKQLIEKLNAKK